MEVWWPPIKVYFTPFINMKLRVFEAFSGVGSQRMALRNLGIDHEVVAIAEIDKFAIKSYEAIHGKTNNLGDISQIETADIPDHDLFTYSFPCQDISVAGKGLGLDEGSDTRSGLLWECQKVIAGKRPKYLLLENVKNLVGKKHKHNFDRWLDWLEEQGYTNYWQVLNAKNYGIPQNRERVFVVSILGDHTPYKFPEPIELELRLKDVLEEVVDEKFYLTEVQTERLIQNSDYLQDLVNEPRINVLAHRKKYRRNTQVFDPNGITETLDTGQGGGRGHYTVSIPDLIIDDTQGYDGTRYYTDHSPTLRAARSGLKTIGVKMNRNEVKDEQDIARTLLARDYKGFGNQDMNGVVIAASRGRNPKNPSDRTVGSPSIITHNYTEQVKVRKHEVDISTLRDLLRSYKQASGKTNKEISEYLDEPVTLVEHWFRNDKSFAIPKEDKWLKLKEILSISTDSFDEQIMEFEIRDGVFDQANRAYDSDGISPTLTATDGDKKILTRNATDSKEVENASYNNFRIRKLTPKECWRLMGFSDDDFHKAEAVNSNTQLYKQAGNSIVVDVLEGIFKQLLEEQK